MTPTDIAAALKLPPFEKGWVWLVGGGPGDPGLITALGLHALAAADFIVVPTSLHPNDVDAVPRTLHWLEKLQRIPTFQAKLAGVILNRTYHKGTADDDLTKDENLSFHLLEKSVQKFLPTGGAVLKQLIKNSPEVARFAGGSVPLGTTPTGHEIYKAVACELHKRLEG